MALNSRKTSNGRSPLLNPQRQITSFFSKRTSPSPSSIPCHKDVGYKKGSPSPNPTTPLMSSKKMKTQLLIDGDAMISSSNPCCKYGKEVIGRHLLVYWPLDKSWYKGRVHSYDANNGKHSVKYNDGDEELLELGNEKIDWIEEKRKGKPSMKYNNVVEELLHSDNEIVEGHVQFCDANKGKDYVKYNDADEELLELENDNIERVEKKTKLKRLRRGNSTTKILESPNELVSSACKDKSKGESARGNRAQLCIDDDDDYDVNQEDPYSDEEIKSNFAKSRKLSSGKVRVKSENIYSEKLPKDSGNNEFNSSGSIMPVNKGAGPVRPFLEKMVSKDVADRFIIRDAEKFPFLGMHRKDANKRGPGEKGYDPRTLYLPPEFVRSLSSGQRQWWEFKSKHMDKVLFFKMGKFYELFEMDAHVGAIELNLQYMKGDQPHCGFPEKNFSFQIEKLARKGYRVLVVEQTETPEQLEMRRKENGSKDKVVRREICAVVTKGTLTEGELLSGHPDASYLMAITENIQKEVEATFGVCFVDVATNRVILGQFVDDAERSLLCSILSEMRPVEIVKPAGSLSADTEKVLQRHTRTPLVNELIPNLEFWDAEKTVCELKSLYKCAIHQPNTEVPNIAKQDKSYPPLEPLQKLIEMKENSQLAVSALGGVLFYLKQAFLDETLIKFFNFELLPHQNPRNASRKPYMVLDAAALENLEIFENNRNGDSSGTLYGQLNHCVTAFGKRLLRAWLARPLYHANSIRDRQVAISCFKGVNQSVAMDFRKSLVGLPDMERLLVRVYSSSGANGRNANKVVLYEDAARRQLKDFISSLHGCELMNQACSSLSILLGSTDSQILRHLLNSGEGRLSIQDVLKVFKDAFDWEEANSLGRIIPRKGIDHEYDSACAKLQEIESRLQSHIKEQQKRFGNASISYVTVGKDPYLLEIPEHLRGSVPADFELRSSRKGFHRYWSSEVKKLVGQTSSAENEKESALKNILRKLILQFSDHHEVWRQLTSVVAELDVLISLSTAGEFYEGASCRPALLDSTSTTIHAKNLGHPVLRSDTLTKGSFVPNDVSFEGEFVLLTGPNMGGKSTLLRQVCLAVILAQMGVDVPAQSFELSPVDRIFVRMGAKDHIMAGQSTFFNELSETALMLNSATRQSLVALDELGRGTSTSDGQAIANAVLDYLVRTVQCGGMFSTHYHRLAAQYENHPKVSLRHMVCHVEKEGDVEEVAFLYRMASGGCPKSYGVNVARLAGLPDCVLRRSAHKSAELEGTYAAAVVTQLSRLLSLGAPSLSSLLQLHHRASLLTSS